MKLTKTQLRRLIKEEIGKVLNEGMVANIEKTDASSAEKLMNPMNQVSSRRAPSLSVTDDEDKEFFIVTLTNGREISASLDASGIISLFDSSDMEIDNEALEQEILSMINRNHN